MTQRTLAFDFYLDLIAGHVIPMQNATEIAALDLNLDKNITTEYLQNKPVELHMMPLCDLTTTPPSCSAKGKYINDDGLTLNTNASKANNERHTYTITYNHNISTTVGAAPDTMEIVISGTGPDKSINGNDLLGAIQIYDYTNMNFTGAAYDVSVTQEDTVGTPTTHSIGETVFR